jgi:tRNA (guanine-N7-)-methyltransferase
MKTDKSAYTIHNNPYREVAGLYGSDLIHPADIMGRATDLELEIGFGRGNFIRDRAMAHPEVRILGIETKRKLVYECREKAAAANLANVFVFHGDAREAVTRMAPDGCFQNVFVLFPDPWWKARHAKRLVVSEEVTAQIVRLLAKGGRYFVQTAVDFRAQAYRDILMAQPGLRPVTSDGFVDENPFDARSSREKRAIAVGMPVFRILFERI